MEYKRMNETVYIRFDKGDEIISGIMDICEKEGILSGSFYGLGCCSEATVYSRFPNPSGYTDRCHRLEDTLELDNITGTISMEDDGSLIQHTHAVFTYLNTYHDQKIFAGHLVAATVLYTAEITLQIAPEIIHRKTDPITGIRVISFH